MKEDLEFENFLKENKIKYEIIFAEKTAAFVSREINIYKVILRHNRKRFTLYFGDSPSHSATGEKPEIRSVFERFPYAMISKSFMDYKEYCKYYEMQPFKSGKINYSNYKHYKKDKNLVENLVRLFGIEFMDEIREKIKSLID